MKKFIQLILAGSVLALAACGGDDGGGSKTATVRAGNFVSDATSGVEFLVDDTSGGTHNYGTVSSYSTLENGTHTFVSRNTATGADFITQSLNLVQDTTYTYLATGNVADGSAALFTDDRTAPASGNFKIRIINASKTAGNGSFDVYITAPGADLFSVTPSVSNLSYRSASSYVSNAAGTYQIRLTRPGTKTSGQFFDGGAIAYTAGQIRTIVISNRSNGVVHAVSISDN